MFLKASLPGLKKQRGGWGGRSPPHLQTQRRYDVSERVHMGSVFAGKMLKKGEPPLQLETDCLYDEFWKALKQFCVWCKSSSWCYVLESKPAQPKKRAGVGGEGWAPPICKHNVFMTGSERVHMGSVFAGRMMLEATLLSSIKHEYSTLWYNEIYLNMT